MSVYLWDRAGPPDPEVEALERVLSPLRFAKPLDRRRLSMRSSPPYALIAASVLIGVFAWQLDRGVPVQVSDWSIAGAPGSAPLHRGQRLRTNSTSPVTIQADNVGEIQIDPNSELSIVESRGRRQRMVLERGRIHALIWAQPREFVVDTPSARAVDLGCQYTLSVDAAGNGFLSVEIGWVAFQVGRRESFIPAGAACRTTRVTGPGIPYFQDADSRFVEALAQFESTGDEAALSRVISIAGPRDGLSLWHLLTRVSPLDRGRVFRRFAQLVPLAADVTEERVVNVDPEMLDRCWNALQLDDADWWREWKREWRPPNVP